MGIFPDVTSAMNAVFKSLASGANPVAMEFLDKLVIQALREKLNVDLPSDAGAVLVGDVDGSLEDEVKFQLETLEKSFNENGGKSFVIAQDDDHAKELWFARRNASPAVTIFGTKKLNEDISVPRSMLPVALEEIYKIGDKYGMQVPCFGHAGDGNIHMEDGHKAIEEIFQLVVDMGGTLSGEHGIGTSKAPYMDIAFNDAEMNLFKNIKKAFDPNNILNPFKMGLD
ncbi:glycolate oxidase subunit GlcD [Aduncisulcus paluster]|uniref:Glycolate oxidase subunit GlcD n=1 Tax=Aduncisulcus paluster TaxID=2918883 RepID=A0ABQ5KP76_9EUKA|nr:glycolate oxidase subunit GlcD [Aduncisulcus paluster]